MLKVYDDRERPAEERERISARIKDYNNQFDDSRPILRKIAEFPRLLWRMRHLVFTSWFLLAFLKSVFFLRFFMLGVFYLMLPFDLFPERVFGFMGLIDDFVIGSIFISFGMAGFVVRVRRRY